MTSGRASRGRVGDNGHDFRIAEQEIDSNGAAVPKRHIEAIHRRRQSRDLDPRRTARLHKISRRPVHRSRGDVARVACSLQDRDANRARGLTRMRGGRHEEQQDERSGVTNARPEQDR